MAALDFPNNPTIGDTYQPEVGELQIRGLLIHTISLLVLVEMVELYTRTPLPLQF